MVGTDFRERLIAGSCAALLLRDFLETALGVLIGALRDNVVNPAVEILRDELLGGRSRSQDTLRR